VVSRRWTTTVASSDPDGPQLVPLGDGKFMVGDRFVSTGLAGEHDPTVRLSFAVVDGVPQCRRVEITATDGGREVRPSDVHSVHLEHVLELVYSKVTFAVHDGSGLEQSWSATLGGEGVLEAVRSARKGRPRKMTPALLAEVATIYREHVTGTPSAEVARRFEVTARTARLYVQRARQAGLLGDSIPGRAGETTKEDS
jgi:transposase